MQTELRNTGISAIPHVRWGTHFCLFYESGRDLLDVLTPYVKAGLESNEFCLVMTDTHLSHAEVMTALAAEIPDLQDYISRHAIEFVRPEACYLENGRFDCDRVLAYWSSKLQDAVARGFTGMRANGDEAWVHGPHWHAFSEYEHEIGDTIVNSNMIVLCAYPLSGRSAADILDVARTHEFVVARRNDSWDVLETATLKKTKWELEHRMCAGIDALEATHAELNVERAERSQLERELQAKETMYRSIFEGAHEVMVFHDAEHGITEINPRATQLTGYTPAELRDLHPLHDLVSPEDVARIEHVLERVQQGHVEKYEVRWRSKHGDTIYFDGVSVPVSGSGGHGTSVFCSLRDITDRKQAEQALARVTDELKALSRRLVDIQEAERRELSREMHDRIGQNLTALGINLNLVKARLPAGHDNLQARLDDSISLLSATADATVNLLSELRPPMLDDLGLLAALEWHGREFAARTGIHVSVTGDEPVHSLCPASEIALFRIAQEALTNIAKHSGARHVDIELTAPDGECVLVVADDGIGLDDTDAAVRRSGGFGMVTMRERSFAIGGQFEVSCPSGTGTSITVRVPSP